MGLVGQGSWGAGRFGSSEQYLHSRILWFMAVLGAELAARDGHGGAIVVLGPFPSRSFRGLRERLGVGGGERGRRAPAECDRPVAEPASAR